MLHSRDGIFMACVNVALLVTYFWVYLTCNVCEKLHIKVNSKRKFLRKGRNSAIIFENFFKTDYRLAGVWKHYLFSNDSTG